MSELLPMQVCALHEWQDSDGYIRCVRCGAVVPVGYFDGVRDMDEVDEDMWEDDDDDMADYPDEWDDSDEWSDDDYEDGWYDEEDWDE